MIRPNCSLKYKTQVICLFREHSSFSGIKIKWMLTSVREALPLSLKAVSLRKFSAYLDYSHPQIRLNETLLCESWWLVLFTKTWWMQLKSNWLVRNHSKTSWEFEKDLQKLFHIFNRKLWIIRYGIQQLKEYVSSAM